MRILSETYSSVKTMRKYLTLAKLTFEEYFVYRLNFLLWRFRSFISFLTLLFFWLAIYGNKSGFLGYQKSQMLTYVVGIAFLRGIVLGSRSVDLAGQVRSGELSKVILAPLKIFQFWFTRDLVDKSLNLIFTLVEIALIISLLKFPFYLPKNWETYFCFVVFVLLSMFLYFFLSFVLSLSAFWTEDVWAARWLFGIIFLEFFAGAFFPIDVLPKTLAGIINLTPFPYLVFFPLKIWLEQITAGAALKAMVICGLWLLFFYWLAKFLWQKGIKNYGAYGG